MPATPAAAHPATIPAMMGTGSYGLDGDMTLHLFLCKRRKRRIVKLRNRAVVLLIWFRVKTEEFTV